ncbi:glutathione synthase/RimK-type ligase-like ATP-grasp enzyme [Paenibacillus forsythiae]|uniref:Glutathione synthase/RimK-type ligase-like ATP-grasp enzyme n=1 Tax=Paenibacillus forsythiae TaxID=365616 RepID=A0ABU3HEA8_9BACL|nr:YheC/YheD family protein [Paenibacillus forsythiae]MDT3429156.1 glutathione synthase/RimK-type ligase-like ATP-grasp enzyme [Paenibacillus forsythiae]
MEQKLVGILLNAAAHRGVPQGRTGWESLACYEEAADAYGLTPCYLKLADIDPVSGCSAVYIKSQQGYKRVVIPIPEVIHNRAIYPSGNTGTQRLAARGVKVFNLHSRYGKDEIHRLLSLDSGLVGHLPGTDTGSGGLIRMMEQYPDLILKPRRGSIGKGIMRLRRKDKESWTLEYLHHGQRASVHIHPARLPGPLLRRVDGSSYLIQERIPLAEAGGRPFDLRVTVQRGWGGEWVVTGLFAKLAPPGGFVSNIARGGEAATASFALEQAFPARAAAHYRMSAAGLALAVARCLERGLPGLADIGLDIGVTRDGQLFFIECNGRDQRYGFIKAGLPEIWKDSYRRPMGYARYLLDGGAER